MKYPKDFVNKIIGGDCVKVMKNITDNSIDLTVTSPPYDNLRKYKGYTLNIKELINELYRVTKQGGVVVWVVGDATIKGNETGTSFKQALYFKKIGFNLYDTMIYAKKNPFPLTHRRYEQQFEYMFIFSKGRPKTFNPIMVDCKNSGIEYNVKRPQIYDKGAKRHYRDEIRKTKKQKQKFNIWFFSIGIDKNKNTNHTAPFPEQLANDHIISWTNEGDIVLDPMCGSGTTCNMAKFNNRNFIGIEISEEYCKIARTRLEIEG